MPLVMKRSLSPSLSRSANRVDQLQSVADTPARYPISLKRPFPRLSCKVLRAYCGQYPAFDFRLKTLKLSALAEVLRISSRSGSMSSTMRSGLASLLKSAASTPIEKRLVCPIDFAIDSVKVPLQLLM